MASKTGCHFIINLRVYPFDVMVSLDESDEILLARLMRRGNTKDDCAPLLEMSESTRGRCGMLPSNQTVIRLVSQPSNLDMIALVSHEVLHAAVFILDRIGVRLEISVSDEAYAYLVEFLTTEIHKRLDL